MSKSGFASEKVMKNYLSALLTDEDAVQQQAPEKVSAKKAPLKVATKTAEAELRPVAKLLEKVNVIEQAAPIPAPKAKVAPQARVEPKPAPAPVAKAPVAAPVAKPLPTVEALVQSQGFQRKGEPPKSPTETKEYRKGQFQALFFDVAGLTVAVPLTELGGIHNMGKLNSIVGKPGWFMGVMVHRENQFNIVNTAKWVMPEKYDNTLENDLEYQYIIMLDNSPWGLACEKLVNTVTLEQDEVKWRENTGRRPWLAGLIKERMCALIDVSALIEMLEQGQGSQDNNS